MLAFKTDDYATNTDKFDVWIIVCYIIACLCQLRQITGPVFSSLFDGPLNLFYLLLVVSIFGYLI